MQGWIKFHRSITEWEWYSDINTCRLFQHLLLTANHADNKWQGIDVKAGQRITSIQHLANETNLSLQNIRTALKNLKSTGEITTKPTNKYTIVTIENWAFYQGECDDANMQTNMQTNKQLTRSQQATNKRLTTNKNDKNVKNEKNDKNKNILLDLAVQSMRKKFGGTKDAAAARKKLPALIDKYGVEVLDRCVTRYMSEVEHRRESGFTELRCVNEGTFWNGRYESYLDENYDYQDVVAELNDKWLNKDGSKPDWLA